MNIYFTNNERFLKYNLRLEPKYLEIDHAEIELFQHFKRENNFYFGNGEIMNSKGEYIIRNPSNPSQSELSLSSDINRVKLLFTLVNNVYLVTGDYALTAGINTVILTSINLRPYLRKSQVLEFIKEEDIGNPSGTCQLKTTGNYEGIIDFLTYVTPVVNLQSILDAGMLYNNIDRIKHNIRAKSGHGHANQNLHKLCEGCTNFEEHPELSKKCGDSIGITFGVLAFGNTINSRFEYKPNGTNCCLYFYPDILKDKYYHINTLDNQGFYIYKYMRGYMNEDDLQGKSFDDSTIKTMTKEEYLMEHNEAELLLRDSVSLEYLFHIEFQNPNDYNHFKDILASRNITSGIKTE